MIVALAISALLAVTLIAPHAIRASVLKPRTGVRLWTAVLLLRAVLACALALIAVFYVPATEAFNLLTHWCIHAVVPFFAQHLGFDGHYLGDAAVMVPALVIGTLLASACFGTIRAARAVRALLKRHSIGEGPRKSTIVPGAEIVVAAAGVRDPKVVVSAGALVELDEDELAAGLEHEWGHIANGHGRVLVLAQACLAMSRFVPGGSRALRELQFQLEREADEYAVHRTGDALALAAAITKAAMTGHPPRPTPALSLLGGARRTAERVRLLIGGGSVRSGKASMLASAITSVAALLAIALTLSLPALVAQAPAAEGNWHSSHDCEI